MFTSNAMQGPKELHSAAEYIIKLNIRNETLRPKTIDI